MSVLGRPDSWRDIGWQAALSVGLGAAACYFNPDRWVSYVMIFGGALLAVVIGFVWGRRRGKHD